MKAQKFRWSRVYESSEEELLELLEAQGTDAERVSLDAFESIESKQHTQDSIIWCAEGSSTFTIDGRPISMQPGDALRVPSDREYAITAGMTGCAWYEAVAPPESFQS